MSLGLHRWAATTPVHRLPPTPSPPLAAKEPSSSCAVAAFFVVQSSLAFAALGYVGLKLKWDLTFGMDPGHEHPHIPEEDYIQDNNNVLSVFMVAFSLDTFEPLVVLLLSNRWARDVFSALCMLFNGAAAGCLFVMVLLQHPPILDSHCGANLTSVPPAPPHSPVFTGHELAPLFALTILLSMGKIASYVFRAPQAWKKPCQ